MTHQQRVLKRTPSGPGADHCLMRKLLESKRSTALSDSVETLPCIVEAWRHGNWICCDHMCDMIFLIYHRYSGLWSRRTVNWREGIEPRRAMRICLEQSVAPVALPNRLLKTKEYINCFNRSEQIQTAFEHFKKCQSLKPWLKYDFESGVFELQWSMKTAFISTDAKALDFLSN